MVEYDKNNLMIVKRVPSPDGGTTIDPPLAPWWRKRQKLEWRAAVTTLDTGVPVRVPLLYDKPINKRKPFVVCFPHMNIADLSFEDAWDLIPRMAAQLGGIPPLDD